MARLIGYARVSTDEQADERNSLPAQEAAMRRWAAREEHEVVRVGVDSGLSGLLPISSRPALAAALLAVEEGEVDGLLVWRLDRLSRDALTLLTLARKARDTGWALHTVSERLDLRSAFGRFMLLVMAGLAELESGTIGERTKLTMTQARQRGQAISRWAPFGTRVGAPDGPWENPGGTGPRLLVPCPAEQALLALIIRSMDAGESPYEAAKALNRQGLKNPRGARRWVGATVGHIYDRVQRERIEQARAEGELRAAERRAGHGRAAPAAKAARPASAARSTSAGVPPQPSSMKRKVRPHHASREP